jgi:hypothetical protein
MADEAGRFHDTLLRSAPWFTETARRFYLAAGYADQGSPKGNFGTSSGYPMARRIAAG